MNELRRLFGYLRPYRGRFALGVFASIMVALFTIALPVSVWPLIDSYLKPVTPDGAESTASAVGALSGVAQESALASFVAELAQRVPFSVLILLVFVGKGLFSYISRYMMGWVAQRAVADLRVDIGEAIARQSVAYFSDRSTGEFISRMTSDPEKILQAMSEKLYDLIKDPLTMVAIAGYLFYLEWPLAIIALVLAPAVIVPVSRIGRKLRKAADRSQQSVAELSSSVHELVRGIRVVKAACAERLETRRIARAAHAIFSANMRAVKVVALTPPVMELLAGIGVALTLFYGRGRIVAGEMSQGEFISFLVALFTLYTPAKSLTRVQASFEQAIASARRCFAVIDSRVAVVEAADAPPLPPVTGDVVFERVSFKYEQQPVLDELDLTLPAGAVTALVGRSGSGKSTVANLILRFYDPTAGRITIDGHDLREVEVASLRAQIGFVPQDVVLFNDTLRNNISYGMNVDGTTPVSDEKLREAARAAFIDEFIETLPTGYDTVVGEAGVKLSTGQRQRISIARALLKDPPCLVLDEATSALDTESEVLVVRALGNLMRGRTTLVIAHRLSTVRRADRIHVLDGGRLRESGTHEELMRSDGGLYNRLVELQASGELYESELGGAG